MKPPLVDYQKKHQGNSKTKSLKEQDIISVNVCLSIFLTAPPTVVIMLSVQRGIQHLYCRVPYYTCFYYYGSESMLLSKMLIHMLFYKKTG